MNRKFENINWSDEVAVAVKLVGKAVLKFFGWLLSILMTIGLVGAITGTIVGGAFLLYAKTYLDTSVDSFDAMLKDKNLTTSVSYIDSDGKIVELTSERLSASENRVWVEYSDFNEYMADAFIAIEDERFEQHSGVDWLRTIKCTFMFFTGSGMQGASTITQQLIKNVTGDNDTTIQRKAQEILKALNLEKKYDKTQIIEMYANNIYLSQGCYGIGAAAYTYFGKEVKDLTLIETAAIAGITQNPSRFDPIIHPEFNAEKRDLVLEYMYDQGKITQEEFTSAYKQELVLKEFDDEDETSTIHSWYTDAAQQEAIKLLQEHFGYTSEIAVKVLLTGGYNIVTALDPEIQEIAEDYYENADWERVDDSPIQPNSSCVIINPYNGHVVALVGSRGKKTINLGLNYATQTKRPPGSSIKPIGVYGPALEYGKITCGTALDDAPINFGTEIKDPETGEITYSNKHGYPKNSPDRYRGLTTVNEGIRVSINTISWRTLSLLGPQNSFDFLKNKVGISTLVEREAYADGSIYTDIAMAPLSMGELTWGATVKEMTAAYQIFANRGIFTEERIVLQILDSDGEVVIDNEAKTTIAISAENASIMTKMLQDVTDTGNAKYVTLKKTMDCAGKTGTTQGNKDRWFVGYTPYYVMGVWHGYSMPRSLSKFAAGKTAPIVAWDAIMTKITKKFVEEAKNGGEPLRSFETAPGVIELEYCKSSGKLMTDACRADPRGNRKGTGWFTAETRPTEYCDVHFMVDYDSEEKAIAAPGCDPNNIVQVGLMNILRQLPFNIVIEDAQYTGQILPEGYSYEGLDEKDAYYANLLPDGYYTGHTSKSYYNHVCIDHIVPVIPDPVVPVDPNPDDQNQGGELDQGGDQGVNLFVDQGQHNINIP